jgi:hypothetical protein
MCSCMIQVAKCCPTISGDIVDGNAKEYDLIGHAHCVRYDYDSLGLINIDTSYLALATPIKHRSTSACLFACL